MIEEYWMPRRVWFDSRVSPLAAKVYAVISNAYMHGHEGVDPKYGTNEGIAEIIGANSGSISRALGLLRRLDYIAITFNEEGVRTIYIGGSHGWE